MTAMAMEYARTVSAYVHQNFRELSANTSDVPKIARETENVLMGSVSVTRVSPLRIAASKRVLMVVPAEGIARTLSASVTRDSQESTAV